MNCCAETDSYTCECKERPFQSGWYHHTLCRPENIYVARY